MTIRTVAERAGVSHQTVANVLNGRKVSAERHAAVMQAIRELDYKPNAVARQLASSSTVTVGVVQGTRGHDFTSRLLAGALGAVGRTGAQILLEPAEAGAVGAAVERLLDRGANAILLSVYAPEGLHEHPRLSGTPVVIMTPNSEARAFSTVRIDEEAAAEEMTSELIGSGRRRIAFLDAPPEYAFSDARRRGYLRALEAHGAPVDASLVVPGSTAVEESVAIADALLALPSPPTAIFAWNDDLAACALIAAHRRGLDIPADLAVAGFDDNDLATKVWPALTTVHQPIDAMAALAVERLVEHVRGREVEWPQHVTVDHKIIRRQSTATPAAPAAPHLRPQ